MVTYIVQKLGLAERLNYQDVLDGDMSIDMDICESMFLVRDTNKARTWFHLLVDKQKSILLPNPVRTDTRNPENWLYLNAAGDIPQEVSVQEVEEEMAGQDYENAQNINLEAWCGRIESEQQRQGAELQLIREDQLHHSQQMEHMSDMLRSMMQHFNIHQAPPPGQQ